MKFDCDSYKEHAAKRKRDARAFKESWQDKFAWLPIRVGSYDCRWLETVQRRGYVVTCGWDFFWKYEYRAKVK